MAVLTDIPLAAATIKYNGVQFGGSDATYHSTPPTYRMRGQFVYDSSGRTVKYTRYVLIVNTSFHGDSAAEMATVFRQVKEKLSKVGKSLTITGLGTEFNNIDVLWGPKPLYCDWSPIGVLTWELSWAVEFNVCECQHSHDPKLFLAFNFDTTWQNDFEGLCTRTIQGTVEIAGRRSVEGGKIPLIVADAVRERINVVLPRGFRRISSRFHEAEAKNTLQFSMTDVQEGGTPLPPGIIQGGGGVSFSSVGPGFERAIVTLDLDYKVAPGYHPAMGGALALIAAQTKYQQMMAANGVNAQGIQTIVPISIEMTNRKFQDARHTHARFSWAMTKCVGSMMANAGIWQPVHNGTFDQWQTSVVNLWKNRGVSSLGSVANEAVIIDLCNNTSNMNIGATPMIEVNGQWVVAFNFGCPNIPSDGGWLGHDLRISVHREDLSTVHRKAVNYLPQVAKVLSTNQTGDQPVNLWKTHFDDSQGGGVVRSHSIEYHGNPEILILLEFRGLRMQYLPIVPEIKSIGGVPVEPVHGQHLSLPRRAFDLGGCPVWFNRGYRLYRATKYFESVKATLSPLSCPTQNFTNQDF